MPVKTLIAVSASALCALLYLVTTMAKEAPIPPDELPLREQIQHAIRNIKVTKGRVTFDLVLFNKSSRKMRIEASVSGRCTIEGAQFCPVGSSRTYVIKSVPGLKLKHHVSLLDLPPNTETPFRLQAILDDGTGASMYEFIPKDTNLADSAALPAVSKLPHGEYGVMIQPIIVLCDPSISDRCDLIADVRIEPNGIFWWTSGPGE